MRRARVDMFLTFVRTACARPLAPAERLTHAEATPRRLKLDSSQSATTTSFPSRTRGFALRTRAQANADDASEVPRKKTRADVFESLKNQPLSGTKYKSTGAFQPTRVDDAKAQIVRFLEYKPRTRKELFDKLTIDKGYEAEDANEALDAMQRAGVQSDAAYAEAFARYKWRNSRWAAWRVRGALRQKGVDDRDIDLGFGPVFAEGGAIKIDLFEDDEDDDEDDEENLERTRAKELLQAARTQFKRNKRGDFQARVRRLMAWLERRGHGGSVIRDIVTVLKREEEYSDDDEDDGALHFDD
jgi:SOS response regulatory protein OraA/RecX